MRTILTLLLLCCPAWGDELPPPAYEPYAISRLDVRIVAPAKVPPGASVMVQLQLPPEVGTNYVWTVTPMPETPPVGLQTLDHKPLLWLQGLRQETRVRVFCQVPAAGLDPVGWDEVVIRIDGQPTPPGPEPLPPVPPTPIPPDIPPGLGREIYDAALRVQSPTRRTEALLVSGIFASVAARAAGLAEMTPGEMVAQVSGEMQAKLGPEGYARWKPLRDQLTVSLKALNLPPTDKPGHIEAWNTIAAALRAVP